MKKNNSMKRLATMILIIILSGISFEKNEETNQVGFHKRGLQLVKATNDDSSSENNYEKLLDNHESSLTEKQDNLDFQEIEKIAGDYLTNSMNYNGAPFVELFEKSPGESSEEYLERLKSLDYQNWLKEIGYSDLLKVEEEFYTIDYRGVATDEDLATQENFQNHLKQSEISDHTEDIHRQIIQKHLDNSDGIYDKDIRYDTIQLQYNFLKKSLKYKGSPFLEFISRKEKETDYEYLTRLTTLSETPYELSQEESSSLYRLMPSNQIINQYEKWLIEEKGYQIRSDGKFVPSRQLDGSEVSTNINVDQLWENYFDYNKTHLEILQDSISNKKTYYVEQNNFIATSLKEIRGSLEPETTTIQVSTDGRIGVLPKEFMTNIEDTEITVLSPNAYDIWTNERQELFQRTFHTWSQEINVSFGTVDINNPGEYYGLSIPDELFTHMSIDGIPQSIVYDKQIYQGLLADYYLVLQIRLSYSSFSDHEPQLYLMTVKSDGKPIVLFGEPEQTEGGTTLINFQKTSETSLQKGWEEVFKN